MVDLKKTMKTTNMQRSLRLLLSVFLLSFFLSRCSSSKNVTTLNSDEITNMVNSSQFIFVADRLSPLRGGTRYLSSYYYLDVDKDTLTSFLPFLGRIYHPLIDPTRGSFRFTSTNFTYDVTSKNKNGWNIVVKPKDYSNVEQLDFQIFDNGTANLNIFSTDRDNISFSGRIENLNG